MCVYCQDEVDEGGGIAACQCVSITRLRVTMDTTQPQAFRGPLPAGVSQGRIRAQYESRAAVGDVSDSPALA